MRGTVVVVGAGLAGLGAARALRALGYPGRVVLIGDEPNPPYDRPPLSKEFLAGAIPVEGLSLVAPQDDELDLEVRLGVAAASLDPVARGVVLTTGESLGGDGVVLATGARARALPAGPRPAGGEGAFAWAGVHTLRSLDDAMALRRDLRSGARLVVVGAGFIGAEVASTARGLGVDVTVVEAAVVPLSIPLGERLGAVCGDLHADHGVRLITGTGVSSLLGDGGRVRAVLLEDGRQVPADAVVVGVGSAPQVEWLAGSGLDVGGGVLTDDAGATGVPGVVATGDCTRRYQPLAGRVVRQEHWTNALHHPQRAAAVLLGAPPPPVPPLAAVPYFWSDQYGLRIQFAGHRLPGDREEVVEGDVAERAFVATYRRHDQLVAVLAMDAPRSFGRWRRRITPVPACA